MSELDISGILERLDAPERYESSLRESAAVPEATLAADSVRWAAVERYVQLAAQAAIDIGNHIIGAFGWRSPTSYADVFEVLKEEGVLSPDLAASMSELAKVRNILVHMYLSVDVHKLYTALQEGVGDLRGFAEEILRLIESQQS